MKSTMKVLAAALAAAGLMAAGGAAASTHSGHFSGGGGHFSGGHFAGSGHFGGHGFHHFGGARFGFFLGVPLVWGWPYYWDAWYGYPYYGYAPYAYGPYAYAPAAYAYPDDSAVLGSAPSSPPPASTTQVQPNAPGAPTQGPAYMNYCSSAKAYFPKVTQCPEGWKFIPAR